MGQLFIKRIMFNSVRLVCLLAVASLAAAPLSSALAGESDSHEEQKLQDQDSEQTKADTLVKQGQHLRKVMPVLKRYMATPKSYYLNTEMYHDSLDNRAAMLADFSAILIEYQKQLVSLP